MSSAANRVSSNWAKPLYRKVRPVVSCILTAASVAICLSSSTGRAETSAGGSAQRPASAEVLQALKPYAAAIGKKSRRLTIDGDPKPAPAMAFTDKEGAAVSLAEFKGKIVLLNFWATYCVPCVEEMPSLNALQEKLGGEDFEVVTINVNPGSAKRPLAWFEKHEISALAFYHDRSMESLRATGSVGLPTTLLIDRAGREIGRLVGEAEWDSEGVVEAIRLLIDDAPAEG